MRIFFDLLYHAFAFAYDFVAFNVSFGKWRDWGREIIPFLRGPHLLELGHGPGHLQQHLIGLGWRPLGLDESAQMGRIAARRIGPSHKLARGLAQALPFESSSLDCIASTFPTEYIFDPQSLAEIHRCLTADGRLVVLPAVWPKNWLLTGLYRISGESPEWNETLIERISRPFRAAGFEVNVQTVELQSAALILIIAEKR